MATEGKLGWCLEARAGQRAPRGGHAEQLRRQTVESRMRGELRLHKGHSSGQMLHQEERGPYSHGGRGEGNV